MRGALHQAVKMVCVSNGAVLQYDAIKSVIHDPSPGDVCVAILSAQIKADTKQFIKVL